MQRRVAEVGDADGEVDALLGEVDVAVVHHQVDLRLRMRGEKAHDDGHHVQAAEAHRTGDAHPTDRAACAAARAGLQLVGLVHQPAAALVELAARLGGPQPPRAALEQAHAETLLQRGDLLARGGLAEAELVGRAREAARLHDARVERHDRQPVHSCLRGMDDMPARSVRAARRKRLE